MFSSLSALTARDGGNAKGLSGTILAMAFAIFVHPVLQPEWRALQNDDTAVGIQFSVILENAVAFIRNPVDIKLDSESSPGMTKVAYRTTGVRKGDGSS